MKVLQLAEKTGTAQVSRLKKGPKAREIEDHAWFVSFAPAEDPSILIITLVEHGGSGGSNAAPISRELMKTYFGKKGMLHIAEEGVENSDVKKS